jgi:hypothetical protein
VLEEGDGADRWGRPVGDQKREGEGDVGRQGELGRKSGGLAGKRWAGGLERRGGLGRGFGFSFFSNSFQTFKFFSNLNTTNPIQIILKTFKTSREQTINIMQPKDDAQTLIASKII